MRNGIAVAFLCAGRTPNKDWAAVRRHRMPVPPVEGLEVYVGDFEGNPDLPVTLRVRSVVYIPEEQCFEASFEEALEHGDWTDADFEGWGFKVTRVPRTKTRSRAVGAKILYLK